MTPWKIVLGAGAACAACCAAPILSGAAALGLGASGLFAGGVAALGAPTDSWSLLAWAGSAALAVGAGLVLWQRRRSRQVAAPCGCALAPASASCGKSGR